MGKSYSTKGNQGGMGPIVTPQPKKVPGSVWRNMKSFDDFILEGFSKPKEEIKLRETDSNFKLIITNINGIMDYDISNNISIISYFYNLNIDINSFLETFTKSYDYHGEDFFIEIYVKTKSGEFSKYGWMGNRMSNIDAYRSETSKEITFTDWYHIKSRGILNKIY